MNTPNTTFDLYHGVNAPPAAADVQGATGHLRSAFARGMEGSEGDANYRFTDILEVTLDTDIRDNYPLTGADWVYVPDKDGQAYRVIFDERVQENHGPKGKDYKRVYLHREDMQMGVTVRKNSGANVGTRQRLNFIEGANITLTVSDDGTDNEVDVTIAGSASYTDEQAQDAIGTILADSDTIDFTYNDGTPSITASARYQMSITADGSGLKLSGDSAAPGNNMVYGTDSSGTKGWQSRNGVLLHSSDNADVASVSITNLTGYKYYRVVGFDLQAKTTLGSDLRLRTSTNNGSSYDSGASDYRMTLGTFDHIVVCSLPDDSSTGQTAGFDMILFNPGGTALYKVLLWDYVTLGPSGLGGNFEKAAREATADIDALSFFCASGNLNGSFRVHGYN